MSTIVFGAKLWDSVDLSGLQHGSNSGKDALKTELSLQQLGRKTKPKRTL